MIDRLNLVYFGDFEGELFETYLEVAKSNDVYTSYHAPAACATLYRSKPNSINIYRQFDT
jgi:hypothetical protein